MAVKNFLKWPDKRLRSRAHEIAEITEDIILIWNDMVDTMNAMPGIGLAAPQIGFNLRLAVIDASEARNKPVKLANPEILQSSLEYSEAEEASPNLRGVSAKIKRPKNSVMNLSKVKTVYKPQAWEEGLIEYLKIKYYLHMYV